MSKRNLILTEVFDIKVYDGDELLFEIDTMKKWNIERDFSTNYATLFIEDAVVDSNLLNMILSGELDYRILRIEGLSNCIDSDGLEHDSRIDIQVAKLFNYWIGNKGAYNNSVTMFFRMPIYVNELTKEPNGKFSISTFNMSKPIK